MKFCRQISLLLLLFSGCTSMKPDVSPQPTVRPTDAGLIRQVNRAEYYFVFESGKRIPPGTEMTIIRKGRKVGKARVSPFQAKKFQVADLLSGSALPGDLCEPEAPILPRVLESQTGQQSQSRSFSP